MDRAAPSWLNTVVPKAWIAQNLKLERAGRVSSWWNAGVPLEVSSRFRAALEKMSDIHGLIPISEVMHERAEHALKCKGERAVHNLTGRAIKSAASQQPRPAIAFTDFSQEEPARLAESVREWLEKILLCPGVTVRRCVGAPSTASKAFDVPIRFVPACASRVLSVTLALVDPKEKYES